MQKPDLISPAGDWTSLRAAIKAGADAVYFGIRGFSMRQNTKNFSVSELQKIVSLCHSKGVKAYIALNIVLYDDELARARKILVAAKKSGIDAVICWDMSVISICERLGIPVHLSTQASISNFAALKAISKKFSCIRQVVLARELSLDQVKSIIRSINKENLRVEIEVFIHGAMCVSVSGRCFISQFLFGRSANRGDCLQPCRRGYKVYDPEEGHELCLSNNYVMSPKDLCVMPFFEKLLKAGISAFKIEGRNRSPEYVKEVTESYREAIDAFARGGKQALEKKKDLLVKKLESVYNRGFSSGFYLGRPIGSWTDQYGSKAKTRKEYIGRVKNYFHKAGAFEISMESGQIVLGDKLMVQGPTTGIVSLTIISMQKDKKPVQTAIKGDHAAISISDKVRKNDKVYKVRELKANR